MKWLFVIAVILALSVVPLQVLKDLNPFLFQATALAMASICLVIAGIKMLLDWKKQ